MATATKRITVLVTTTEKEQLAKKAKADGLSMDEFLRRAAASFCPSEDERLLEGIIDQINKTTRQAKRCYQQNAGLCRSLKQADRGVARREPRL
jgi:hypothetical protein